VDLLVSFITVRVWPKLILKSNDVLFFVTMVGNDYIKNKNKDEIDNRKNSRILILSLVTSVFMLFAFVYVNSVIWNHKIDATTIGNSTHPINPISTAVKTASNKTATETIKGNANKTENNSTTSSSSTHQPNSNVSRLTTTQGNVTTNANAPGSPFPPKEANSTSYFPATNKVAIVVGAALLRDKAYQPNPVNVKAGGVVTWNNDDTVVHTVTSGTGLQDPHLGNQFDSGLLGGHFSHIFFKPGTFPYFCQIHPTMVGKIIVK